MRRRIGIVLGGAAVTLLALTGCTGGGSGGGAYGGSSSSPSSSSPSSSSSSSSSSGSSGSSGSSSGVALTTGTTSLGKVLVDGRGLTVYVFDKDTKGATKSACAGACASQWPAVETASATPATEGVTGTVGTITGIDGRKQVTVNGWPLYTYAGDSSAGAVTGQGIGGLWWAVGADGNKIGSASSSGAGGY